MELVGCRGRPAAQISSSASIPTTHARVPARVTAVRPRRDRRRRRHRRPHRRPARHAHRLRRRAPALRLSAADVTRGRAMKLSAILIIAALARTAAADDRARAELYFRAGEQAYRAQSFGAAASNFEEAY